MKKILTITLTILACLCLSLFAISCASSNTFKVTFDLDGGTRVGGGAIIQEVESADAIVAPTAEKEGYTFVSWDVPLSSITKDANVKAIWEKNKITVTFSVMGGEYKEDSGALTQTVKDASSLILPVFTRKGYTLSWDKKVSEINTSCTVIGVWVPNEYKITFLDEDGKVMSDIAPHTIRFDQHADKMPVPKNDEKKFVGWKLPSGYMLTEGMTWTYDEDVSVTAVWTDYTKYAINYDLNGGSPAGLPTVYIEGKGVTLGSPTRKGYSFFGWTECSAEGEAISGVMSSVTIAKDAVGDKYYKANWIANQYKIHFANEDGALIQGINSVSVYYDRTVPTLPVLSSEDKKFVGWKLPSGAMLLASSTWNYDEDKTVRAVWAEIEEYSISIDFDGGEEIEHPSSYKEGNSVTIGSTAKRGYTFLGWIELDSDGAEIGTLKQEISIKASDSGDKYFKAKWKANVYQIIFCNEEGLEISGIGRIKVTFGEKVPVLPVLPNNNRKFVGWKLDSGESISAGQVWDFTENQFATSCWVAFGKYNININLDGGNQMQYPTTYIEGQGATINAATRTGYTFLGWLELDAKGNVLGEAKTVIVISKTDTGDKYYRATWQVKSCTVYFVTNNGTASKEVETFTYGQVVKDLPTVSGNGGSFICWEFNGQEIRNGMIWLIEDSGIELTAKFARKFKITLSTEVKVGDKVVGVTLPAETAMVIELAENEAITLPTAVAKDKEEYTFRGWKYVTPSGKSVKLESNTVLTPAAFPDLDLENVWTVEITLVPYCTANWSGYY